MINLVVWKIIFLFKKLVFDNFLSKFGKIGKNLAIYLFSLTIFEEKFIQIFPFYL